MRVHFIFIVYLMAGVAASQAQEGQIIPSVTTARVEDGSVTVLHLAPGYTTSIRLPDEISSVVVGNPASFKAEHSESEAKARFLQTDNQPAERKQCPHNHKIRTGDQPAPSKRRQGRRQCTR